MKKVLFLILTVFALNASAQSTVKVGVVNAMDIFEKSAKGQQIQLQLVEMQRAKRSEFETRQNELYELEKQISSPDLSSDAREQKTSEFQGKRNSLQKDLENAQREFQKESDRLLAEMEKDLTPLVENYGKANGFTIIYDIQRAGIVYFDNAIDVTANIISEYDAGQTQ